MIHKLIRKIRTKLIISLLYWDLKSDIEKEPMTLSFRCYVSKKKQIEFDVKPTKWK